MDVYAERPGLQGRLVQWIARADLTRRWWTPLEAVGEDVRVVDLPYDRQHGGQLRMAVGTKAG